MGQPLNVYYTFQQNGSWLLKFLEMIVLVRNHVILVINAQNKTRHKKLSYAVAIWPRR